MMIELFKFITKTPKLSYKLLERLRFTEARDPKIIEGLVF